MSISVRILNIFVRIWAQWSVDWSHVWLASSADCRREGQNFNAVLRDFLFKSASFNQAKYIFGHVNDPSELKYRQFFHGHERNICLIETMFDWHWAL